MMNKRHCCKVCNTRYLTGLRDRCIIMVMLRAGLRLSELTSLKVNHIDWQSGRTHIHEGKGHKDRIVYLDDETMAWCQKWLGRRLVETDLLFCTLEGKPMTSRPIQHMIDRRAKKAGISKHVYPHLLRHTMATELLNGAGNIRLVQKALGHSSLATTMIYTHVTDSDLERAMKKL